MNEPAKKPWMSKTIWINLIMSAIAFFPIVSDWVSANPTIIPIVFTVVNIVLRLISKDKIALTE